MKIGIDGGALSISDDRLKVGVYRVASHVVNDLPALRVKDSYRVYGFGRGDRMMNGANRKNVQYVSLPRPGYQKIWQPIDIIQNPIQVYLGISQSIPLLPSILCDVRKIGFIYDVGFLTHPGLYPDSFGALTAQTAAVISRADHILTISHASKAAITSAYGLADNRVSVSYLGVEPIFSEKCPAQKASRPYFLYVGALKRGKNIPMMLRAFAAFLAQSKKPYDFVLIGSDYWMDPDIAGTIEELGIAKRVRLLGFLSDKHLAAYYRGATALVTVSLVEGFGLPATEAMSAGCPVIASDVGSYPEVVGTSGLLVSPTDSTGIASAMIRMASDASFRTTCITRGHKQAKRYSWAAFIKGVARTIEQVV